MDEEISVFDTNQPLVELILLNYNHGHNIIRIFPFTTSERKPDY